MTQDFSPRMTPSFFEGVLLAINGISDSALAVEGPACTRTKMERVCRNHDVQSSLHDPAGAHRVCTTDRGAAKVLGSLEPLKGMAQSMLDELHPGALFLLPFAAQQAMGMDLEGVARELSGIASAEVYALQSQALDGDWLDGWATVLSALAGSVQPGPSKDLKSVCVAGLLHTRDEGDDNANGQEVTGLLLSLGFRVRSIWAEGHNVERLKAAGACAFTIGLPHARKFSAQLAAGTESQLIEAPLPLGLSGTTEFLQAVGRATGLDAEVEHLVELETRRCTKVLNSVVSLMADEISVAVLADPVVAPALHSALSEIGIDVPLTGILSARSLATEFESLSGQVAVDPSFPAWERLLQEAADSGVQMVVGSGLSEVAAHKAGVDLVELGYPCQNTHFLTPTPLLGYQGFLSLVERIANTYCQRTSRLSLERAAQPAGD
jgi:nitrogenase molybdenum-iron protein alpha/beta subunit